MLPTPVLAPSPRTRSAYPTAAAQLDLVPLVRDAVRRLRGARAADLRVDLTLEPGTSLVRGPARIVAQAVDALCINALLLAGSRGRLDVRGGTTSVPEEGGPRDFYWIDVLAAPHPVDRATPAPPRLARQSVCGLAAGLGVASVAAREAGGVFRAVTTSGTPYHGRLILPAVTTPRRGPGGPWRRRPLDGVCVLLAEGDAERGPAIAARLVRAGGTVVQANGAPAAAESFEAASHVVAAAVVDATSGSIEAAALFRSLRTLDPDVPIVFLGHGWDPDAAFPFDSRTDLVSRAGGQATLTDTLVRLVGGVSGWSRVVAE